MGYINGEDRNQYTYMPECLDEYIEADNPVRVIDVLVDSLDIEELKFKRAVAAETGRPGYSPKDLLKLYLYSYMNRIRSSRRMEKETKRNIELMWLINKISPDFKTIADFRKDNKEALAQVFKKFTILCKKWGLYSNELVAIDGSKFKAWNSKKRNFSNKTLDKNIENLNEKIENYLKLLDENDKDEFKDNKFDLTKISAELDELKKRKAKYEKYRSQLKETGDTQISETDSDSKLMPSKQGTEICYNVQTVVEEKNKLVIDFEVTNDVNDFNQLSPMSKKAKELLEVENLEVLADKGYNNPSEFKKCVDNGINPYVPAFEQRGASVKVDKEFKTKNFKYSQEDDVYICPSNSKLCFKKILEKDHKQYREYSNSEACKNCELKDKCTKNKYGRNIHRWVHQDIVEKVEKQTKENWSKYQKRQQLSEHPFGTIKRGMDSYYLLTKGFVSVKAEMALSFLAYNLKRIINIMGCQSIIKRLVCS